VKCHIAEKYYLKFFTHHHHHSKNIMVGPKRTGRKRSASNSPSTGPTVPRGTKVWTQDEDELLWKNRASGRSWETISEELSSYSTADTRPTKSANACRKRHERIKEQKLKAELGPNMERWSEMVQVYLNFREEWWSRVGAVCGHKNYQDIEKAVCRMLS